jgi:hypothetical protein
MTTAEAILTDVSADIYFGVVKVTSLQMPK